MQPGFPISNSGVRFQLYHGRIYQPSRHGISHAVCKALADAQFDALLLDAFSNYMENRNFDLKKNADETHRIQVADSLMRIACKRYKDVYYIYPNATSKDHDSSVDGTHPGDHGYTIWEQSIEKKVLKILKKYGISVAR